MLTGLGVISYKRPQYLKQCLTSLEVYGWGGADLNFVVIDHEPTEEYKDVAALFPDIKFLFHGHNYGVGAAKNTAIKHMQDKGCEHFFIMEDDILMKDANTCQKYIDYAYKIGVQHTNFALHGPMNVGQKLTILGEVCVYPDCVGAFSYYTKECLDKVGLIDEKFFNAYEHVEHTWRMAQEGMTTPFWFFVDHPDSADLLEEIPGSIDQSSIRPRPDWLENISEASSYFVEKHGHWLPIRPDWEKVRSAAQADAEGKKKD